MKISKNLEGVVRTAKVVVSEKEGMVALLKLVNIKLSEGIPHNVREWYEARHILRFPDDPAVIYLVFEGNEEDARKKVYEKTEQWLGEIKKNNDIADAKILTAFAKIERNDDDFYNALEKASNTLDVMERA